MKSRGRPFGSKSKPQIRDYVTEKEVKSLVLKAKKLASEGNESLLKFLLEQVFGKAPQHIDATLGITFSLKNLLGEATKEKSENPNEIAPLDTPRTYRKESHDTRPTTNEEVSAESVAIHKVDVGTRTPASKERV